MGKQCMCLNTYEKPPIRKTEIGGFLLVEALPQAPANTRVLERRVSLRLFGKTISLIDDYIYLKSSIYNCQNPKNY